MSKTEGYLNDGLKLDFGVQFRLSSKTEFKTCFKWKGKVTHCSRR